MMRSKHEPLTDLIAGATSTMVALTALALFFVHGSEIGSGRIWLMVLASAGATILVMSLLHSELQRMYSLMSKAEADAWLDARVDSLTGIGNRKYIMEHLEAACVEAPTRRRLALLLIDLDQFKRVNDTCGHAYGDELIAAVSGRLNSIICDGLLARLGGDEFSLLVNADDHSDLAKKCEEVAALFDEPFELSRGPYFAGGSVGACFIEKGFDPSALLRRSDLALYHAKTGGKRFHIFDDDMARKFDRMQQLSEDLRICLDGGDGLFAHFQEIATPGGECKAMEAFLRWKHPDLGMIAPLEIVSVAEESQLIVRCEKFMARQALEAVKLSPGLKICLNVSGLLLLDETYADWLVELATSMGISPKQIVIEVREKEFTERAEQFSQAFDALSGAGFQIAVDNFGTDLASLAGLRRKGVSILKLDRRALLEAQKISNVAVLRATVELVKAMNMRVVAAGVDTAMAKAIAVQAGCDYLQGYHISRPCRLEDVGSVRFAA